MSETATERPEVSSGLLRVVVLGAYGLIGSAVTCRLMTQGHDVIGVGRSSAAIDRQSALKNWQVFDIGTQTVEGWKNCLQGADVVVNASGALQDGARDDLTAIHQTALERIGAALEGSSTRLVQISAAGVSETASTEFFRSKARGETALRASDISLTILRPTMVLSPSAYGGTALLRAGAATPFVLPRALPNSIINCVHIDDLAETVLGAVEARIPIGTEIDVTGDDAQSLPGLMRKTRKWLGFPKARFEIPIPGVVLNAVSRIADVAGKLGWRSPLRSTAIAVLRDGVRGDPSAIVAAGGRSCRSLDEIFAALPTTPQERWFARLYLLFPLILLTLAFFWLASGVIGFIQHTTATDLLTNRGTPETLAQFAVLGGSLTDVALGAAVLWRPWAERACLGMIALSVAYLVGGAFFAPDLWLDPLGPMVKVFPSILLAMTALAILDDR